jgi:hypothetical protein
MGEVAESDKKGLITDDQDVGVDRSKTGMKNVADGVERCCFINALFRVRSEGKATTRGPTNQARVLTRRAKVVFSSDPADSSSTSDV